jgi:hypothetical protein
MWIIVLILSEGYILQVHEYKFLTEIFGPEKDVFRKLMVLRNAVAENTEWIT